MKKVKKDDVIRDLSNKKYLVDKNKNILIIVAIVLTTFMITVISSMGISYWNAISKRSCMMEGMKYDIQLPEPTKEQVKRARQIDLIKYAGLNVKCAVIESYEKKPAHIRLFWSDEINWKYQCVPAFEMIKGRYPEKENEIMMSTQTLKELGIKKPEIGMKLSITYQELSKKGKTNKKELFLSGYFRDYSGQSKGFVSKTFYDTTGAKQTDLTQGYLNISLKNPLYSKSQIQRLEQQIGMENNQMIFADYDLLSNFIKFAIAIFILALLVITSGYLFIYNILYISVSKEIRFYGQLKTIGFTSKEIKRIVYRQIAKDTIIGVALGLFLGETVSGFIVPAILKIANATITVGQPTGYSLQIFSVAIVFALMTVYISCRKPIKIAGMITPIEALKYNEIKEKKKFRRSMNGGKLISIAWRNMFRNKKQAVIIFLSFFVALTSFVTINTLVKANSAEKILNTYYDYDFRVLNETISSDKEQQVLTDDLIKKVEQIKGVRFVQKVMSTDAVIPYSDKVFGAFLKRVYDSPVSVGNYEEDLKLYKLHPENSRFLGKIVAVDKCGFEMINKCLKEQVNEKDFIAGKVAIVEPGLGISAKESVGKNIRFYFPGENKKESHLIKIASEAEKGPNYYAAGIMPDIIVSDAYLKRIKKKPLIELLNIVYDKPFQTKVDKQIKKIFEEKAKLVSFSSKMSDYDEMKQSENQIMILGRGIGLILALLAMLNYANMMASGIQNRMREFATLESIGMTSKQLKEILILEGLGYWLITGIFVGLIGTPLSYFVFTITNKYGVSFEMPMLENGVVLAGSLIVCVVVPLVFYHVLRKDSLIEQLKETIV